MNEAASESVADELAAPVARDRISRGRLVRGVRNAAVRLLRGGPARVPYSRPDYQELYELHAAVSDDDGFLVGGSHPGDFERFGLLEFAVVRESGLSQNATLVDLGCGTGRLAVHVVPWLEGRYVGIDIARKMLSIAERRLDALAPETRCEVTLLHSNATTFPLENDSVDMICAFSVFTHLEHEDSYRYLVDARRVVKRGGVFVYSCLPLELPFTREIFRESAAAPLHERWSRVRNVVTSRDLLTELASMAGWTTEQWHSADEPWLPLPGSSEKAEFGHSIAVLRRP